MDVLQIISLSVIAVFYLAYFTKMFFQHRNGIQTDQIGKGSKPKKVLQTERLMKIATIAIVPVEIISIIGRFQLWKGILCWIGVVLAVVGVLVFVVAMAAMRDSWRAGIPEKDRTELVTTGIYRFSRNPAFLGFDLVYIGLLLAYFNPVHFVFCVLGVVMLHLQILQEEVYLAQAFGDAYLKYKRRAGRYFLI